MTTFHLIHENDTWKLKREGSSRATRAFETKEEGKCYSIQHVRNRGGSLKIHKQDGTIQEERTYPRSADPKWRKG